MTIEKKQEGITKIFNEHDNLKYEDKFYADMALMVKIAQFLNEVKIELVVGFPFEDNFALPETFILEAIGGTDGGEYEDYEFVIGQLLSIKLASVVGKKGGFDKFPDFSSVVGYHEDKTVYQIMYFKNEKENEEFLRLLMKEGKMV
ncbi:hypothetical protein [Cetobacterium sp.]|uniref:hypothetical protein n=1 Tax=Cetobacterium sp. TaxID=2071632 RepID=UPI003F372629